MSVNHRLQTYLAGLENQGLLRTRAIAKQGLIAFDSNDYLSLSQSSALANCYQSASGRYPAGSTGSMYLNGYHPNHQALERAFAQWLGVDECLLFPSGFAANLAITALLGKITSVCCIDKSVHASIYDGLHLSKVTYHRYPHNDLQALESKLAEKAEISALITEGIFSMSGQIAPLTGIQNLCKPHGIDCIVDEAHSIGLLGPEGKGAVAMHALTQEEVPLRMIAFGKAFAAQGALVAGQSQWIHALMQAGRSGIYSTAMSPLLSYGLLQSLDLIRGADEARANLAGLIDLFRDYADQSPFGWTDSRTPIQQLQLGCPRLALSFAAQLRDKGFSCSAIRPPTVSHKAAGLRIILNAGHSPEQIRQFFKALESIYESTSN